MINGGNVPPQGRPRLWLIDIMWPISQSYFHVSHLCSEIKFIHCHSYVMFVINSMNICNDEVHYVEIII